MFHHVSLCMYVEQLWLWRMTSGRMSEQSITKYAGKCILDHSRDPPVTPSTIYQRNLDAALQVSSVMSPGKDTPDWMLTPCCGGACFLAWQWLITTCQNCNRLGCFVGPWDDHFGANVLWSVQINEKKEWKSQSLPSVRDENKLNFWRLLLISRHVFPKEQMHLHLLTIFAACICLQKGLCSISTNGRCLQHESVLYSGICLGRN